MLQHRILRRFGGRLALAAIWLQLAFSFGHIHPGDIFPYGHAVFQGHGITVVAPARGRLPPIPSQPDTGNAVDVTCAICASMAMVATLVLPEPVRLPLPLGSVVAPVRRGDRFVLTPRPYLLFRTRAPPIA